MQDKTCDNSLLLYLAKITYLFPSQGGNFLKMNSRVVFYADSDSDISTPLNLRVRFIIAI